MINTGKLAGRTVFITGASRGIGKAIALKVGRDGGNVIIAAKTATPHPKLPGTIYTAAKEVEEAGGKCLPCVVDIRNEDSIREAVQQAVKTFGGIDILVNNASAISLTGTQDTPMKKFDLMFGVNVRGTYATTQACLPYLMKGRNPHVLNISPPLNMQSHWFKNHVAYTMAKYGMSMCVLGMAEELKGHRIAVNALWPRTAISTAAMKMLGGDEAMKQCRKADIMADAAYAILTRDSRSNTGKFLIDEFVLKECGMSNFDEYAEVPGEKLMPDFFLNEEDIAGLDMSSGNSSAASSSSSSSSGGSATATSSGNPVTEVFEKVAASITPELVESTKAIYLFEISGEHPGTWYADLKNGSGSVGEGAPAGGVPDVTMRMSSKDFVKMFSGKLSPTSAFMTGKLKISGNMGLAMKLEKLMKKLRSKL